MVASEPVGREISSDRVALFENKNTCQPGAKLACSLTKCKCRDIFVLAFDEKRACCMCQFHYITE